MLSESLIYVYENDLRRVMAEIKQYEAEEDLWKVTGEISNSGGNLALHLIGNVKHYLGAVLGGSSYKRERDKEFSNRHISRKEIIRELENAIEIMKQTLGKLTAEDFEKDFPQEFSGQTQKTLPVVIYMLSHLAYHLGQINYHRRLLSK